MWEPMATLEEVLVPIYFYHRYQLEAAAKILGGLNYTYALRGDGQTVTQMIPPEEQRQALKALLETIQPESIVLPQRIVQIIPPRPDGYFRNRETFNAKTGVTFDPLSAAEAAADMTVQVLLNPERAARLIEYHSRDEKFPGFPEVIDQLYNSSWKSDHGTGYSAAVKREADNAVLFRLMELAANEDASGQVRAVAFFKLNQLKEWLGIQKATGDDVQTAHIQMGISQIDRFQKDPKQIPVTKPAEPPAGPPIGMSDFCNWNQ